MALKTQLTDATLLSLVDAVYAAATDPRLWPEFLRSLPEILGGTGAVLLQHDMVSRGTVAWFARLDPDALRLYQEHYNQIDPWATSAQTRQLAVPGCVTPDAALLPRNELKRTEFYQYMKGYGLSRMINATLARDASSFSSISIYRNEAGADFGRREARFLKTLAPHMARALEIHRQLEVGRQHMSAAVQGLDSLPCAAALVDVTARVVAANRLGEELLSGRDGLSLKDSRLCGPDVGITKKLRELCSRAAGRQPLDHRMSGAMSIQRGSFRPALQVMVSPVALAEPFGIRDERAVAVVFISEPERDRRPDEALLRLFYRLTATEAQICASLACGRSSESIAGERRYTQQTVRWYTKQILHKTGCRTRSELVRLISRTLPSLSASGAKAPSSPS